MDDSPLQQPIDPNLATEQAQAQNDLVGSMKTQTAGDMASLMARYGTQLAMAGTGAGGSGSTSPLANSPLGGRAI